MSAPIQQVLLMTAAPPVVVTWNPSDKAAGITLSGSNLIATASSSTDMAVRATVGHSSGKFYFELTPGATYAGGDTGMGIARLTANIDTVGQNATLGALIFPSGAFYFNGVFQTSLISAIGSFAVGFAIDLTNQKLWARNGSGDWNSQATDNPATNTGGFDISALFSGQSFYPCQAFNSSGSFCTANFAGPFANAAPSGFTIV